MTMTYFCSTNIKMFRRNSPTLFQSGFPPLSSQPGASTILHPNISVNQSSGIMPPSDYQTDTLDLLGSQTHFHPINPDDPQLDTSIEVIIFISSLEKFKRYRHLENFLVEFTTRSKYESCATSLGRRCCLQATCMLTISYEYTL